VGFNKIENTNFNQTMWITQVEIPFTGRVNPIPYMAEIVRNFYLVGGFINHVRIQNGDQVIFFADNIDASKGYLIPISFVFARSKNLVIIIEAIKYIRCYAEFLWLGHVYQGNSIDFVKTKQSITKYDGFQSNTYNRSRL
jgi:hypothetical protein